MNWTKLENNDQLASLDEESKDKKVLIFKHSTRCSISSTALDRLERNWKEEDSRKIKPYYLDLLAYRSVSNEISSRYKIEHQSPQVLLIQNGICIYHASHLTIDIKEIMSL
jgi:bacillithiol system protein YtxJ